MKIKWYEGLILALTGICAVFFLLTFFSTRAGAGGTVFAQKGGPVELQEIDPPKGVEYAETGRSEIGKLDLNRATVEELAAIPEIGEKRAAAILDWRLHNGLFEAVDDLLGVEGFDRTRVEYLEQFVTVSKDRGLS